MDRSTLVGMTPCAHVEAELEASCLEECATEQDDLIGGRWNRPFR